MNYTHWENRGLLYHSHCLHTVLEQSGIKLMSSGKRNLSFSWLLNCIHNSNRTSYNLKHMANKLWHIAESNLTEQATFTFLMKVTISLGVDVILDLVTNLNHTWTSCGFSKSTMQIVHYCLFKCFFFFSNCTQIQYSLLLLFFLPASNVFI